MVSFKKNANSRKSVSSKDKQISKGQTDITKFLNSIKL